MILNNTDYKTIFLEYLQKRVLVSEPENLYSPISYILGLGGKRLRPILVLISADTFGINYKKALDAALAVEVFHNFSLLHDDVMDLAPMRRNKETVHKKWGVNTAILSGDAMLIMSYQFLESYDGKVYKNLMQLFNKTALEVCKGQQLDVDFESKENVSVDEYINMIRLKTSVLIAAALKMGAIIAKVEKTEAKKIYYFGLNMGIAFQIKDDYLDIYGNSKTFGKQEAGDIIKNKKTYLYIKAINELKPKDKQDLIKLYQQSLKENNNKIKRVKEIFKATDIDVLTKNAVKIYTEKAFEILETMEIPEDKKSVLRKFAENLMTRTF